LQKNWTGVTVRVHTTNSKNWRRKCDGVEGVGPIVEVNGKMKGSDYIKLLSAHLLPYMQSMGYNYIFMEDNDQCDSSKAVIDWMHRKKLKGMEVWPPQSPDLNPIEHVWDLLATRMESYKPQPEWSLTNLRT